MLGSEIVIRELKSLAQRIADNIRKNGQTASGRSERSLNVQDEGDSIVLYGRKAFGTLETGRIGGNVPRNFSAILYQWSLDKRISFDNDRERRSFAYFLAKKIQESGTQLFRDKGRADVYSNEIPKTLERINQSLSATLAMRVMEGIELNKPQ